MTTEYKHFITLHSERADIVEKAITSLSEKFADAIKTSATEIKETDHTATTSHFLKDNGNLKYELTLELDVVDSAIAKELRKQMKKKLKNITPAKKDFKIARKLSGEITKQLRSLNLDVHSGTDEDRAEGWKTGFANHLAIS